MARGGRESASALVLEAGYLDTSIDSIPELPTPDTPQEHDEHELPSPIDLRDVTIMSALDDEDGAADTDDEVHEDDSNLHGDVLEALRDASADAPDPIAEDGESDANAADESDMEEDEDDDADENASRASTQDPITAQEIEFHVNRACVAKTGLIPCCVFVGRIKWRNVDWEIHFGQKQLLRLHLTLYGYLLWQKHKWMRGIHLPWTIWREKRASNRVRDTQLVEDYINSLLQDDVLRNSDPLLSFLEVSPSRAMSRYGPSLKEGYVHMRMNGAFQLPVYSCVNRTIEALYRHLYRAWMRIAFISVVMTIIFPIGLILVTTIPQFFAPANKIVGDGHGAQMVQESISFKDVMLHLLTISVLIFIAIFVYRFFSGRLGVIRRWVVLKPNCFAAYRRRFDTEPSEVFLFDKKFAARKGSYRQGVSWMPSGFVVGSRAGFIEVDTGHYNTRFTMACTLILACYGVITFSSRIYESEPMQFPSNTVSIENVKEFSGWNTSKEYCGYSFTVPKALHIVSDNKNVGVSRMKDVNSSSMLSFNDLLGSEDVSNYFGILASTLSERTVVGVVKPIEADDKFVESGYVSDVEGVGNITLFGLGLNSSSDSEFINVSRLCVIPISLAVFRWAQIGYYMLLLLGAGMFSATSGLALNYLITYTGIWHAHVRRDHWFRCVKRLQRFKRQETEYRYKSFAPEHSSVPHFDCTAANDTPSPLPENVSPRTETSETSGQSEPSFVAPPPPPCSLSWHVDGEDTYEAMYNALMSAKYEILIAGWWVTPDLYLRRSNRKLGSTTLQENNTQLRKILLLKAKQGVKVYVLIYREVKLALRLNSAYTKRSLMLHPNIRVLRDPIFQIQSLGFWSHHEKIVCIDQSLAFIGGLDLCFGRYDHSGHPLSDIPDSKLDNQTWPGKDYSNPIIKDFIRVNKPDEDLIDRETQPRMPWHDVHCSVSGPPVQDIAYHFIQRWNFVCSKNDYQLRTGWCICMRSRKFKSLPKCLLPMDFNGWRLRYPGSESKTMTSSITRMQRDPSMEIDFRGQCISYPFPCIVGSDASGGAMLVNSHSKVSSASSRSIREPPPMPRKERVQSSVQVSHPNARTCSIQVCRSASMWSAGVPKESSIHEAYLDIIAKAQHYVYIENQFFISGLESNTVVSNRILQALVDRIERAVRNNEVFRVYVVMPLLPAFEGNIRKEEKTNLHAVMHWQYLTISRGNHSLFSALKEVTDAPSRYVSFFGLRKYGILPNGCVTTEQIYIHSKLMIADDRYAIVGSANINDRSMNGDRDSEIALVVEDVEFTEGVMNEQPYRRGVVCGALRMQLMREHLGLAFDDCITRDPASEDSWHRIKAISSGNTQIFESVFDCAPSNKMKSFTSLNNSESIELFENQRMNMLKRPGRGQHVWDQENLKEGDYAPWTDVNGVPINIEKVNLDDYVLDCYRDKSRRHFFSMDHDGWCYARNFSIFQEVRMTTDFRNRDKLKHFMADRLMAQVRRRRYVKKDSAAFTSLPQESCDLSDDEEQDDREDREDRWGIHSIWRRLRGSESDSQDSPSTPEGGGSKRRFGLSFGSAFFGGGGRSYPNSPVASSFHEGPSTSLPPENRMRARSAVSFGDEPMRRSSADMLERRGLEGPTRKGSEPNRRSLDSFRGSIAARVKKWASFIDDPLELGRRSKFLDEYFPRESEDEDEEEESAQDREQALLESGRPSLRDGESPELRAGGGGAGMALGIGTSGDLDAASRRNGQIGQLKTAATVKKEDESRARGQLSEIRGHLVDFPVDFLAEEFLKPSILPRDIHI